ncbi:cyclic nucleotide-binding domain-containing protein [Lysinibacillus capsici]|uniref:Crp/Fnr family transcriptional regulator n=1 Tax=Lysinibacillus capsici TaxID=2115968 RepID=UPI002A7FD8B1|nr:cyclic nucleotide-binding domain-containing protein [Lysinibacillus capsici]
MDNMFEKIKDLFQNHGVFIKVNKGNKIFLEGERAKEIYYIQSGVISISQESETGKELTIRICGPDNIIGEGSLFCNLVYNSMTAKVLEPSTLYVLSRKSLEHLLEEQPTVMVEYMKWLQTENLKHQSRVGALLFKGKKCAIF